LGECEFLKISVEESNSLVKIDVKPDAIIEHSYNTMFVRSHASFIKALGPTWFDTVFNLKLQLGRLFLKHKKFFGFLPELFP